MENKISLILTTYNEAGNIEECINSVFSQDTKIDELIIVDGGSKDGTVEKIKDLQKKYSEIRLFVDSKLNKNNHRSPIAAGRNLAISKARNNIIASFDAGTKLSPNWIGEISSPLLNKRIDVVAGWYEPLNKNFIQKVYSEIIFCKLNKLDVETFLPSSRSIAFKKEAWEKAGKYPELIFAAEDTLFDLNLKKTGAKFFFNPRAIVYWEPRNSIRKTMKQFFIYSYSDAYSRINKKSHLYLITIYLSFILAIVLSIASNQYFIFGCFFILSYFFYIIYKQELYKKNKALFIPLYLLGKISIDLAKIAGFGYGYYLLFFNKVK